MEGARRGGKREKESVRWKEQEKASETWNDTRQTRVARNKARGRGGSEEREREREREKEGGNRVGVEKRMRGIQRAGTQRGVTSTRPRKGQSVHGGGCARVVGSGGGGGSERKGKEE